MRESPGDRRNEVAADGRDDRRTGRPENRDVVDDRLPADPESLGEGVARDRRAGGL